MRLLLLLLALSITHSRRIASRPPPAKVPTHTSQGGPPSPLLIQHMRRGRQLFDAGRPDQAVREFALAAEVKPDLWNAHTDMGSSYQAIGTTAALRLAALAYGRATQLEPRREFGHIQLGQVLRGLALWDQAVSAYIAGIALIPNSAAMHHGHGVALLETGSNDALAAEAFERTIGLDDPKFTGSAHNNLGLASSGDTERAIRHFSAAILIEPTNPAYYNNLGECYKDTNKPKQAEMFRRAIHFSPLSGQGYMNLGNAIRAEPLAAIAAYEMALALDPLNPRIHYNVATVYGEVNLLTKQWKHMHRSRKIWWNKFEQDHEGSGCSARLRHCWWDVAAVIVKPVPQVSGNVGEKYTQAGGGGGLDISVAGPHDNWHYAQKRPLAFSIPKATIEGDAAVMRIGCDVLVPSAGVYSPIHEQLLRLPAMTVRRVTRLPQAISAVSHASANYFHFLCEVIPRLIMINTTWPSMLGTVPLLIRNRERKYPTKAKPFITETLSALGLGNYVPYEHGQQYKVELLHAVEWWPTDHRRGSEFEAPASALRSTRQLLRSTFGTFEAQPSQLVWVSRSGSSNRKVTNEEDILVAIKEALPSWKVVVWQGTEGMHAAAKVFGAATLVVGPHGAGLANILFCDRCDLLELTIESAQMRYFGHLATALGFHHDAIVALPGFRQSGTVQPKQVVEFIRRGIRNT